MKRRLRETRIATASDDDIRDALDHMSDFVEDELNTDDFDITTRIMTLNEIGNYDDLSAWAEWGDGELEELDPEDRYDELVSFRGEKWADRASRWTPTTVPPIVVIEFADGMTAIADGRGRTSYAIGMGWKTLPVTFLVERD